MALPVSYHSGTPPVTPTYQPKAYLDDAGCSRLRTALTNQTRKIVAVWYNREYSNFDKIAFANDDRGLFESIIQNHSVLLPQLLLLFTDKMLSPIPDDIWYDLANRYLMESKGSGPEERKLLLLHAPMPKLASSEAVYYFRKHADQPPQVSETVPLSKPYRPNHPYTYLDQVNEVFTQQFTTLKAVASQRHISPNFFYESDASKAAEGFFSYLINSCHGPEDFLSLFSDKRLSPLPDEIWYDLANFCLLRLGSTATRAMLRKNAPYPPFARQEALDFFHQCVGGQPPKSKLEAFSQAVRAPSQGQVILKCSQLMPVEPPQQPTAVVKQVAPADPDLDEVKALREQMRQMKIANEREKAEKEQLRKELEQKNKDEPDSSSSAPIEKFTCNICMVRTIERICLPCRHMFCDPCSINYQGNPCPNCKTTAERVEKLFFAY